MKKNAAFFIAITISMILFSCKKETGNGNLIGKWNLIEVYDGYANGGQFKWNKISTESAHYLDFKNEGGYYKKENANGNFKECAGTFKIQNSNQLEINSNCNIGIERGTISELSTSQLIIDRQGIEGIIRYKYHFAK